MAVSFSSISGRVYPAWQPALQASLQEPILHGSELFKHLWKNRSCMAVQLFKHLWTSLSCTAISFSSISGNLSCRAVTFQASLEESILHGSQLFKHLWKSLCCMAVSFSSISGRAYLEWQSAFQASLEESILQAVSFSSILWKV